MNRHVSENVRFFYDLGKNAFPKPWNNVIIVIGVLYIALYTWELVAMLRADKADGYLSLGLNLLVGLFFILLGTGKLHRRNKYYLKITDTAVSYRIPGKKPQNFPITNLQNIGLYPSYITFDTKDGWRDMIDFPMLPYEAVSGFKEALQALQVEIIDTRRA